MRPLLLLDVDGVLCPFERAPSYIWDKKQEVYWSLATQAHLRDLQRHYDCVWATMRGSSANRTVGVLYGLPPLKSISFFKQVEFSNQTFKLSSVQKFLADHEGRPVAWVDDILFEDAFAWAEQRSQLEAPTLVCQIDPRLGFQLNHAEELKDFAAFCQDDA